MDAEQVIRKARENIAIMGRKQDEGVTSVLKREDGWTVCVEELERKGIPDTMDILGLYEISMDNEGVLLSVERKRLRKRGDTADN
jgi:hypothetical protein